MNRVMVVGEPGGTAQGDKATMLRLLDTAHQCGCDVWKPQFVSDAVQMCERRHIGVDHPKRAYYEQAYRWLQWNPAWHEDFRDRCHALGMQYACTVFLPQDVATVAPFVDYLKSSSFEACDLSMALALSQQRRDHPGSMRIIASTGMTRSVNASIVPDVAHMTLHCVSAYPAPLSAMNLQLICDGEYSGLSDHTRDVRMGGWAVVAGAEIIETHYRLTDCDPANPDYAVAFTPAEFTDYIKNIRDAELALGDGVKKIEECEREMLAYRVTG